jgi:hypothetical protein
VFRDGNEELYNILHNEAVYMSPESLYYPQLFNALGRYEVVERADSDELD